MEDVQPICIECGVSHAESECPLVVRPTQPLGRMPEPDHIVDMGGEGGTA